MGRLNQNKSHNSEASCICCASQRTPSFLYRKNNAEIYQCVDCGVGHAQVASFDANKYYSEAYFSGEQRDGYSDYKGSQNVLQQQFRQELNTLDQYTYSNQTLLELGCAYGYFLKEASSRFTKVFGLEICQDAVTHCQQIGLDTVKQGDISEESLAHFPEVNVAVMLDVI